MVNHEVLFFGNGISPLFLFSLFARERASSGTGSHAQCDLCRLFALDGGAGGCRCLWRLIGPVSVLPGWPHKWGERCAPPRARGTRTNGAPCKVWTRRPLFLLGFGRKCVTHRTPPWSSIRPGVSLRRPGFLVRALRSRGLGAGRLHISRGTRLGAQCDSLERSLGRLNVVVVASFACCAWFTDCLYCGYFSGCGPRAGVARPALANILTDISIRRHLITRDCCWVWF